MEPSYREDIVFRLNNAEKGDADVPYFESLQ